MTTLDNRPNSALLVIDVQNGVVGNAIHRDEHGCHHRPPRRQGTGGRR